MKVETGWFFGMEYFGTIKKDWTADAGFITLSNPWKRISALKKKLEVYRSVENGWSKESIDEQVEGNCQ